MYQAGTLSGNPLAMTAGIKVGVGGVLESSNTLKEQCEDSNVNSNLDHKKIVIFHHPMYA